MKAWHWLAALAAVAVPVVAVVLYVRREDGMWSAQELRQVAPRLSAARAAAVVPHLNAALAEAQATTAARVVDFIAQMGHESAGFTAEVEFPHTKSVAKCRLCMAGTVPHAAGAQYEGRTDLGNTQRGDGERYKGRGPIQLTGRSNYRAAGRFLGLPLEEQPELVERPDVGWRTAVWFWGSRNLNTYADKGDFEGQTRKINGGLNGYEDRQAYRARALAVLNSRKGATS